MAEGIRELQEGLTGGCPKVAEALKMLGDAAWVYSSQHALNPEEGRRYTELGRDSYRRYLALRPDDSRARFTYVVMLHRLPEERSQLDELVRRDPNFAMGRHRLGLRLIERGQVDAGAKHLVAAARLFDFGEAEDYGDYVVETLKKHGRKKDAAEARKNIDEKLKRGPVRRQ